MKKAMKYLPGSCRWHQTKALLFLGIAGVISGLNLKYHDLKSKQK